MDKLASPNFHKIEEILKKKKIAKIKEENFWIKNFNRKRELNEIFIFDKKVVEKIQNFFITISLFNLKEIERIFNKKSNLEIGIQTENIILKNEAKSEIQNFIAECEKTKLENKYLLALNDVEVIKNLLKDIQNKFLQTNQNFKKLVKENEELKIENENLKEECNILSEKYYKLKEYSERLEENFRIEKEYIMSEENFVKNFQTNSNLQNKNIGISRLTNTESTNIKCIEHITNYLHSKDIINLKHSNSELFFSIERNPKIHKLILKNSIKAKNSKIESLLNYSHTNNFNYGIDNFTFCNIRNIDIESLIKKYSPINQSNNESLEKTQKEFSNATHRSIEFICNGIKELMKSNHVSSDNKDVVKNEKNLFGSVGNMLMNVVNHLIIQNENSNSNSDQSSSTRIQEEDDGYEEISPIEMFFLNFKRNDSDNKFYFHSPNELKNLIYSTFFKLSNPYSTNFLNIYIEEISLMFSHLLFFSIDAVKELIEMRLVKNHLYDRLSHLHNEKREMFRENNELNKTLNSMRYINNILAEDREKTKNDLKNLREKIEILTKSEQDARTKREILSTKFYKISSEYNEMKYFYKKELTNLKFDLEKIQKERNEAVNMLIKLKDFVKF